MGNELRTRLKLQLFIDSNIYESEIGLPDGVKDKNSLLREASKQITETLLNQLK